MTIFKKTDANGLNVLDPETLWSAFTLLAGRDWTTCVVVAHIARNRTMYAAKQQCCTEALNSKLEASLLLPISSNRDCGTISLTKSWTYCACRNGQRLELNTSKAQAGAYVVRTKLPSGNVGFNFQASQSRRNLKTKPWRHARRMALRWSWFITNVLRSHFIPCNDS